MLFLPVAASLRDDSRFFAPCEEMGLGAYWKEAGVLPDFSVEGSYRPSHQ
jgi:hypothetical protein